MEGTSILGILILLTLVVAYFLPTIVAGSRGRDGQVLIGVLNLFLGWTVLGWIVLLVIAFTGESQSTKNQREEQLQLLRRMASNGDGT